MITRGPISARTVHIQLPACCGAVMLHIAHAWLAACVSLECASADRAEMGVAEVHRGRII